ncbi:MAG: GntR family transcriptional regulator [Symbiobacteriia bacterium]
MNRTVRAVRGRVPLYTQLKERVWEMVDSGQLKPGDQVPSERELCERYGISRMTCRQALNDLVTEGVLYRVQGRGTFVANPKVTQGLLKLTGFTEDMLARGLVPETRVVSAEVVPASKKLAAYLDLPLGEHVVRLERIRSAGGQPMCLEQGHLPASRVPGLEQRRDLEGSLYHLLADVYDLRLARANETLEAVAARERTGEILEVAVGSPLLLLERVTWEADGRPIEYVRSFYRGDRYRFQTELVRREGGWYGQEPDEPAVGTR